MVKEDDQIRTKAGFRAAAILIPKRVTYYNSK